MPPPARSAALPARNSTAHAASIPTATAFLRTNERSAVMPNAAFSVPSSAVNTLDPAHSASSRPMESGPGASRCTTSRTNPVTSADASAGSEPVSLPVSQSPVRCPPNSPVIPNTAITAGGKERKK
jgi:hypothetical protein